MNREGLNVGNLGGKATVKTLTLARYLPFLLHKEQKSEGRSERGNEGRKEGRNE